MSDEALAQSALEALHEKGFTNVARRAAPEVPVVLCNSDKGDTTWTAVFVAGTIYLNLFRDGVQLAWQAQVDVPTLVTLLSTTGWVSLP